ncbi:MAG: hypothetical protein HY263_05810 [Chloroflexi bacterium]|nr:hypothetical protein [Chloroflexota bacterium]
MFRTVRFALAAGLIVVLAVASVATAAAASGRKVFDSSMAAIPAGAPMLFGVAGGGVAWAIDEGRTTLTAGGRLHVEVEGLVVAASGVNPIPTGRAIVTCAGVVAATTAAVPFSTSGDAEVDATVSLPSPCFAPAVFFAGVTANGDRWFAVTGF